MSSEQQSFDLASLVLDYWQLMVAVVAVVVAIKKHRQFKTIHVENVALQKKLTEKTINAGKELEKDRRRERELTLFQEKSEPLRNKLAVILMYDFNPILHSEEYLPVSHLLEEEGHGVLLHRHCKAYNDLRDQHRSMSFSSGDWLDRRDSLGKKILSTANKIKKLLDIQLASISEGPTSK